MARLGGRDLPEQSYSDAFARFINSFLIALGLRSRTKSRTEMASVIERVFGKKLESDPGLVLRKCVQAGLAVAGKQLRGMVAADGAKAHWLGDKGNITKLYGSVGHAMQKRCLRSMSLAQALRKAKGLTKLEAIPPEAFKKSLAQR